MLTYVKIDKYLKCQLELPHKGRVLFKTFPYYFVLSLKETNKVFDKSRVCN
ncbi:MAG: hypothetical protein ACK521_01620 [bacterium]